MDPKTEARDFLTSRRAKITPAEAGLTSYGTRQVPGLRREEVATLAGVSVDYYNRMERGNLAGVSDGVLRAVAGAARVAFNWGLARVKAVTAQRAAEVTYGLTGDELTPSISWSLYSLRKDWNAAKGTVAPCWAECSKEAFNTGLDRLAQALKDWDDSRKGKRKGKAVGFPRFRSKRKSGLSVRFTTGALRCEEIPNPRYLSCALRKLKRLSRTVSRRHGPDRRTGRRPSNRWRRASAALGKAHGRVADQRKDSLHKLTSRLASEYATIVVEDLNVAGMIRNRRVARHVADASFGEFRRQLGYKAAWHGGRVIVADRWFASSKTCSGCGAVKAKLPLSERTYACAACGLVLDRDVNAARKVSPEHI